MQNKKIQLNSLTAIGAVVLFAGLTGTVEAIPVKMVNPHASANSLHLAGIISADNLVTLRKKNAGPAWLVTSKMGFTPTTKKTSADVLANLPINDRRQAIQPANVIVSSKAVAATVPDGGITLVMLGSVFSGIVLIRRKLDAKSAA